MPIESCTYVSPLCIASKWAAINDIARLLFRAINLQHQSNVKLPQEAEVEFVKIAECLLLALMVQDLLVSQ